MAASTPGVPRLHLAAAALLLLLSLLGCTVVDEPDRPPPPKAAPAGTPVERIFLSTNNLSEDRNGNRFYDTFMCVVYLFPPPSQSALPMHCAGRMTFELRDEENYTIARWTLSESDLEQVAGVYSGLPGYFLSLNIAEVGDDRVISKHAELSCTFYPADDGPSVRAQPVPVQQIGPIGADALRR
ncbi:MAG: hypothetical protein KDA21_03840 [Phycisphaerales bacterium]|nr:hypothetical protein [Phycisphaerales bacterium]